MRTKAADRALIWMAALGLGFPRRSGLVRYSNHPHIIYGMEVDINGCCERSALLVYARKLTVITVIYGLNWTILHIGPDSLPIPGSCVAARAPGGQVPSCV